MASRRRATNPLGRLLELARIDFSPAAHPPRATRWLLAVVVSLAGSLALDALLVVIGTHLFPGTRNYVHFHFSDYGRLTVIGVLIACLAWPVVTTITSSPRWVFFRMAIVVTLVLLLPDVYILVQGQPARAVAVLMCMHLGIALVTYNSLVHIAPVRPGRTRAADVPAGSEAASP